jgi:abortive infection bacteriophage resistance protein
MSLPQYKKSQISVEEQILNLKQKGLIIDDEARALHYLQNISFFRLKSYLKPLRQFNSKTFKSGATFEQAFSLYKFDSELRKMICSELEKIEVSVRTQLSLILSEEAGTYWFTDSSNFKDSHSHALLLQKVKEELRRSDDDVIVQFQKMYSNPFPPSWMTFEISSFGTLSMIYRNLKLGHARRKLAKFYGLSDSVMESWLHAIVYVRNICAHHCRLWNRQLSINAKVPHTPKLCFLKTTPSDTKRIYYTLSLILYLMQTINPQNSFVSRFKKLLSEYPNVDVRAMGFPTDWRSEKLWE